MTIFPLFKPFLSIERADKVIKGMVNSGTALNALIGLKTGNKFEERRRIINICKACLIKDKKDYGEAYIHRVHRIPGNFLCNKHKTALNYFLVQNDRGILEINIDSLFDLGLESYQIKHNLAQFFLSLGEDIEFVSSGGLSDFSLDRVRARYRQRLQEKGYTLIRNFKENRLITDFKQFYPIDFLEALESNFEDDNKKSWFLLMINDNIKYIHPIRHLLFIRFLFGGAKEFLRYSCEYKPFGHSPYPCLNPAADHYKKEVIQCCELKRTYDITNPLVGFFKCDCGFIYSRRGPDKTEKDRLRHSTIMQRGHIWEGKLRKLVKKRFSMAYIARQMECSKTTIVRYANLLSKQIITSKKNRYRISDTELNLYKEQIAQYIMNNKDDSRQHIIKAMNKQYSLLYARDKQWLEEILPQPMKNTRINRAFENIKRELRDEELLQKLRHIVSLILREEIPRRITRYLIAQRANIIDPRILYSKFIRNLPKTEEYLLSCCETVEEFRNRKA